jgi:hypothetical protein
MDGMGWQPALPGFPVRDRSPLDMPNTRARAVLQAAAVQMRKLVAETARTTGRQDMATEALADALEQISAGEVEAACEEIHAAAALWVMRA